MIQKPTGANEAAQNIAKSVINDLRYQPEVTIVTTHFSPECKSRLLEILSSTPCSIELEVNRMKVVQCQNKK
jgi:hypothetical protein